MPPSDGLGSRWRRALITGASSGIGLAFAERLGAAGADLVVVARNEARLEELAARIRAENDVDVEVLVADLADREQLQVVEQRLLAGASPIDLLVNNAGFGNTGDFLDLDIDDETAAVNVNIVALQRLAHAAGTSMTSRGSGGIINVSSIAGYLPTPGSATYAATKAFVTSLSEALHDEVGPRGVVVTCVCPGLTRTEFQDRAGYDASHFPAMVWQSPEQVVDATLAALGAGKPVVVPGLHNRVLKGALRATPDRLRRFITTRMPR
ncbi:MAG: SDR family NAD(P)-dependent oxidoreductase [Acidimicrobiales bacterium]